VILDLRGETTIKAPPGRIFTNEFETIY